MDNNPLGIEIENYHRFCKEWNPALTAFGLSAKLD
jgi:hypothetical protein